MYEAVRQLDITDLKRSQRDYLRSISFDHLVEELGVPALSSLKIAMKSVCQFISHKPRRILIVFPVNRSFPPIIHCPLTCVGNTSSCSGRWTLSFKCSRTRFESKTCPPVWHLLENCVTGLKPPYEL